MLLTLFPFIFFLFWPNEIKAQNGQWTDCKYTRLHRHPADCTKYLQCSNGYEYIMSCPPDLYFHEAMQYCDYPYNVAECNDIPTTTTETSEATTSDMLSTTTGATTSDGFSTICYTIKTPLETTTSTLVGCHTLSER